MNAAEINYVADQVENAFAIGEQIENQYRTLSYLPRWQAMIVKALREMAARHLDVSR